MSPPRRRVWLLFDVWPWNVDASGVLAMLRTLRAWYPWGFLLVLDRLSAHRKAVRLFLARGDGRVEVEWLPAYTPELNPVEGVWRQTMHAGLPNFLPDGPEHLRREVVGSMARTGGGLAVLRSFFAHTKLRL